MKHRAKLARERCGLSVGQAAKLLTTTSEILRAIEISQEAFDAAGALRTMMVEIYAVDETWLTGDKPLRDYAAVDAMKGADKLTLHDRDAIAEFAASLPARRVK